MLQFCTLTCGGGCLQHKICIAIELSLDCAKWPKTAVLEEHKESSAGFETDETVQQRFAIERRFGLRQSSSCPLQFAYACGNRPGHRATLVPRRGRLRSGAAGGEPRVGARRVATPRAGNMKGFANYVKRNRTLRFGKPHLRQTG